MRVVVAGRHYPMSMMIFFRRAFERLGHEVVKVGPYSGDGGKIPWPGNPVFPQYVDKPDIIVPEHLSSFPVAALKSQLPPDIDAIFSFDAGFRLTGRLDGCPMVLYGTDPHAIDYRKYYQEYDWFFSAQNLLWGEPLPPSAIWVPLAYDQEVHVATNPISSESRPHDLAFFGVMGDGDHPGNAYQKRWREIHLLKERCDVIAGSGVIFSECTKAYNTAKMAWNRSSQWDLPMRIWEGTGYGCCTVTNKLPYLEDVGFVDGETCIVYETFGELAEKVKEALSTGSWQRIAENGHKALAKETYDERCLQMLRCMGLEDRAERSA